MLKVEIDLKERSYPIYITDDFAGIRDCLGLHVKSGTKVVLIADENVGKLYADELTGYLESYGLKVSRHITKAGESSKNLDTVKHIYSFLINKGFDRSSAIIALGGGVTGDIAGFAASTFMRGIRFIQVPTTLLAQSDSSVGGKVGVDFEEIKNVIGSFYQPSMVYINVSALKTLSDSEMRSGLAEVIKHGLIKDADFFGFININLDKIFMRDSETLQYLSKTNCMIKGKVVEEDEKESGLRAILNFGHTIGHAVESASGFLLKHGECVAIGIAGAFRISVRLGMVAIDALEESEEVLKKAGLPIRYSSGMNPEKIYRLMLGDKKTSGGKLNMILPVGIGNVVQYPQNSGGRIDSKLIMDVLEELRR